MKLTALYLRASLAAILSHAYVSAELITNGSFEHDNYFNDSDSALDAQSPSLPGFMVTNTTTNGFIGVANDQGSIPDGTRFMFMRGGTYVKSTPAARISVIPGVSYVFSFFGRNENSSVGFNAALQFFDSNGDLIDDGGSTQTFLAGVYNNPGDTFHALQTSGLAPAGAVTVGIFVEATVSGAINVIDKLEISQGGPGPTSGITRSQGQPSGPFERTAPTDSGITAVRWRANGTDRDLGAVFRSGPITRQLKSITVRVAASNFGSNLPGMPVILDFMKANGDFENPTFVPLWRVSADLPTDLVGNDYITFHLLDQNQALEANSNYAFLVGVNREAADLAAETADSFRLYSSATNLGLPSPDDDAYEIRRDFDFGPARADSTDTTFILNTGRELHFFINGEDIKPVISSFSKEANAFNVSVQSLFGGQYILESSPNLQNPWTPVQTIEGNGAILNFSDSPLPDPFRSFYRVKVGP